MTGAEAYFEDMYKIGCSVLVAAMPPRRRRYY
jgi:hypothetical protein